MPLPTTPIYDRVLSDVTNKTAKGYINTADFQRIVTNIYALIGHVYTRMAIVITARISSYGITVIPTQTEINNLCLNLEEVRVAMVAIDPTIGTVSGIVSVKTDWEAGPITQSPTFRNVNDWERVTYLLYTEAAIRSADRKPQTGIAGCGVGLTFNHRFRG